MKLTIKLQKEEEKRRKQEEQKRLKEEKEFEKMRKKTLQQATRNFKPGECMKVGVLSKNSADVVSICYGSKNRGLKYFT